MIWLYIFLGLLGFLIIVYVLTLLVLFLALTSRSSHKHNVFDNKFMKKSIKKDYTDIIQEHTNNLRKQLMDAVHITSKDGLTLEGYYYHIPNPKGVLLACHGFRSDPYFACSVVIDNFLKRGYDVLAISQRGHGKSEGEHITFGIKESEDILEWVNYLSNNSLPIYLYGISMGSSASCLASPYLPNTVKFIIADCGFSSIEEIFHHFLKMYHLPSFLLYKPLAYLCKKRADFMITDGDVSKALERSSIPIIFIHGTDDNIVPYKMGLKNYEAFKGEKLLITCEGATHAVGYLKNMDECEKAIGEWLNKYK